MYNIYKDKKSFNTSNGSALVVHTIVTGNSKFCFQHCNYQNFSGTELSYYYNNYYVSVLIASDHIPVKMLTKYTKELCLELVMKHIPASVLFTMFDCIAQEAEKKAVLEFKQKIKDLIFQV